MRISLNVEPSRSTTNFANVLLVPEGLRASKIDFDYSILQPIRSASSSIALDFLFIAFVIYSIDKMVMRKSSSDKWTRSLQVNIPVSDANRWSQAANELTKCLNFLTGDYWEIGFYDFNMNEIFPDDRQQNQVQVNTHAVSLFSGGLDSLIGAIDWLETNPNRRLALVGHHDPNIAGPLSSQNELIDLLEPVYPGRIKPILLRVGQTPSGPETTFRSRSLLFLALGVYVANTISTDCPLIIPENGTISLNVPLTPSRRGSCSTRTTHPRFLNSVQNVLTYVGLANPIVNPLQLKTKGECVESCHNQELLRQTAIHSVSCAKTGHRRTWLRRARGCGRCMPCIYRRAALHKIGLDVEPYGRDFCQGEVDILGDRQLADDLRACFSFLIQDTSREDLIKNLLINGNSDVQHLGDYADLVIRARNEIRTLINNKGNNDIKRQSGLLAREIDDR